MPGGLRTVDSPPAVAAVVAVLVGMVAAVQFSVPTSQTYGIATLYLWPIAIVALWFGARIAVGVVGAVMAMQAVWVLTVAPNSGTGGLVSVVLRAATYLFIASLVGHFATRLRRVALTDPLTGLPNRRAFFEEVRRRSLTVAAIGVVTCDVDGLKRINDRDGHDAGDAAIIRTGQDLLRLLGDGGFVARFGGDEFLGLTTPEMGERIAAALDPVGGARVGVAVHSTTGEGSIDAAIAAADQSLYRAKRRAA
jgi:diguanylate cyclase (GGDEF)-like protein